MGATEKLDAAFHPAAGRSGVRAVLDAAEANDRVIEHGQKLQAAVNELRELHSCASYRCNSCGFIWPCPTTAALEKHGV